MPALSETKRCRNAHQDAIAASQEWLPKLLKRLHDEPHVDVESDEQLREWLTRHRDLDARRDVYYEAVRGLYESGLSVSAIAGGLGAPEREIHQITGTLSCSFCGEAKDAVAKLIAGPELDICDRCVRLASAVVEGAASSSQWPAFKRSQADHARCFFCQKDAAQVKTLAEAGRLGICDECIQLCNEILEEEAPASSKR